LSGDTSDFITCHDSVILDPNTNYEAALLSLDTYTFIPNIFVGKNNIFTYLTDGGITWKKATFNTGAYELQAINNKIKRQIVAKW